MQVQNSGQLCPRMGLHLARILAWVSGRLPLALEVEAMVDQSAGHKLCCAVDVLVATPGRLMSLVQGIPGIHLDSLKRLVCHATLHKAATVACNTPYMITAAKRLGW